MAAPLTIGLFGPMRVLVGDAPLPSLRSRKALWLLALMTLRSGRPVSREWVATTLWPDSDQSIAFANLRPVICELRRALGREAYRLRSPDRVTMFLDLVGADVDVLAFDAAIAHGHYSSAARYSGPLLEGCQEEWATQERNARDQDFAKALRTLGDAAYDSENFTEAVEWYGRLIVLDPWRDAPRRGMMRALAKSGDINAALQTYRDFAQTLRNEGGLVPDEKTTALYSKIRTLAQQGTTPPPAPAMRSSHSDGPPGNLPFSLTPLIGRESELRELAPRIRSCRMITLLGPAGIGKSRLAAEFARDVAPSFRDGAWFVSLESIPDDRLVLGHVLSTIRSHKGSQDHRLDSLRGRQMLLVLDDCDHRIAAVADLAAQILRACGDVKLLITSREALGIVGETIFPVGPLPNPQTGHESVRLFVERAQAVRPTFRLGPENAMDVAEICARLEGIPLAIELAATRTKSMTTAQICRMLHDQLRLLTGSRRGGSGRHQTLRAALDWSHERLSEGERILFRRLSGFGGGWTLDAAEWICAGGRLAKSEIVDLHRSLVDKSLVAFDERHGHFRLLEMVRQYAATLLAESDDDLALTDRRRDGYLERVMIA